MKKVKSRKAPAKATRRPLQKERKGTKAVRSAAKKPKRAVRTRAVVRPAEAGNSAAKRAKAKLEPKPGFHIRELDPLRICGSRTSVMKLFRVEEQLLSGRAAGSRQIHLVFNDRHGWYCEHGRSCHAVTAVMRHARIR